MIQSITMIFFFLMFLGGLFAGLPEKVDKSWILTDDVLKYLVEMYRKTGFRLGTIDVISLLLQF